MTRYKLLLSTLSLILISSLLAGTAYASGVNGNYASFDSIANNISSINLIATNLLGMGAFGIGVGFTLSAIMKYKYHRDNPTQVPLNMSVILAIFGIILMLFPLFLSLTRDNVLASSDDLFPQSGEISYAG